MPDREGVRRSETLSEWGGCVGVGLVPCLTNFATAFFAEDVRVQTNLLSIGTFMFEMFLFCMVTTAASVVIFISKHNVVRGFERHARPLPTSLFLVPFPLLIVMVIIFVSTRIGKIVYPQSLAYMLSCVLGTLILSLAFERVIGNAAYDAQNDPR